MKKIVAIILALVSLFSIFSINSLAFESDNSILFGCENDVCYGDPGTNMKIPMEVAIELQSSLDTYQALYQTEFDSKDATIKTTFNIEVTDHKTKTDDSLQNKITKIEVPEALSVKGIKCEVENLKDTTATCTLYIPCSEVTSINSFEVLDIYVDIDENWEIVDYKPTTELFFDITPVSAQLIAKDDTICTMNRPTAHDVKIKPVPYQPNILEQAAEWIKSKVSSVLVLVQIACNLLLSQVLQAPDWVVARDTVPTI